jgi:hypothetical protein
MLLFFTFDASPYTFMIKMNGFFCPDALQDITKGISRSDLPANCCTLLETSQLFRSHARFKNVYDSCNQIQSHDCVLCHVSAHGLH